jgi:hypothetical protein
MLVFLKHALAEKKKREKNCAAINTLKYNPYVRNGKKNEKTEDKENNTKIIFLIHFFLLTNFSSSNVVQPISWKSSLALEL